MCVLGISYHRKYRTNKATQGSYASGKCQGNLNFFRVRELSGNFMFCHGKTNIFKNVREFKNYQFVSKDEKQKMTWAVF